MVDVKIQRPENVMWLQRAYKARVSGSMVELNCPTLIFLSKDIWWSGQVVEVKIPRPKKGTDSIYRDRLQEVSGGLMVELKLPTFSATFLYDIKLSASLQENCR